MDNVASADVIDVGVVGLGLMGSSVVTALLIAGHRVKAIAPLSGETQLAGQRITEQLMHCVKAGLITSRRKKEYEEKVLLSEDYNELGTCRLVLECVVEDVDIKASVFKKITDVISGDTIVASNTSAIPISDLQRLVSHPERFLGIHWAEPAYMTRFLEITCGEKTLEEHAAWIFNLAHTWGKEPTLLRKDIRGFVTNRLMYATYREMFSLIEKGDATIEDVDKALRYDAGSWITLMGIFRRMDYLGVHDFHRTFTTLFPKLCNEDSVPAIMKRIVEGRLKGTQDAKGLYEYSKGEAREWDEAFARFNEDIFKLAAKYPLPRSSGESSNIADHE